MFELRRLNLLHQLSIRGTVSEVARVLSFSPSTVSQQLSILEREAGVQLLVPNGRKLQLTHAGVKLAAHAAEMIKLEEIARGDLSGSMKDNIRVRVAVIPTVAQTLVPPTLKELHAHAPQIRLEILELAPEEALLELSAGSFDMVIAEQYPGYFRQITKGIELTTLGEDPVRIVAPAASAGNTLNDFAQHPWVFEPEHAAVTCWALQQCRSAGFEPDIQFVATNLNAHVQIVQAGYAIALLPDLLWNAAPANVRLLDLPNTPKRQIFAANRETTRNHAGVSLVKHFFQTALHAHTVSSEL